MVTFVDLIAVSQFHSESVVLKGREKSITMKKHGLLLPKQLNIAILVQIEPGKKWK